MNGYYVTNIMAIPQPWYEATITLVSNLENVYYLSISDLPQCTCPNFVKMNFESLEKEGKWVYCKHFY
jgi:hypothetical protein